jgi:hypothetical protein
VLAERFAEFLDRLLRETQQPIRLLAHSMGGLVVRACIHKRRPVMDALMARDGRAPGDARDAQSGRLLDGREPARQGRYAALAGASRRRHDMREVLQIVSGFRGALQLLPKPGFVDCFQGQPDGGRSSRISSWPRPGRTTRQKVFDFWFGDGKSATPSQDSSTPGAGFGNRMASRRRRCPRPTSRSRLCLRGCAQYALRHPRGEGRLKMVGTTQGDGTVTWASGRIGNIGSYYYMPAKHGDLPSTSEYFPALGELLHSGATGALLRSRRRCAATSRRGR